MRWRPPSERSSWRDVAATSRRCASRARSAIGPRRAPRRLSPAGLVEPLTARELEVLRLVAAGRSNRQIAAQLYVTVSTVKTHVHTASGKLGAANRVEAVARARELGLLA